MIAYNHPRYKRAPTIRIPVEKRRGKIVYRRFELGKFFSDAFIPALSNNTAVQIYFGGAGSGKSVSIAQRTILDMLQGKRNFLIVHKVYGALKDSFFAELKKAVSALGLNKYFKFKVSPLEVTCTLNGTMCIFRGMDDPEKVKSITVPKGIITDIIVEEATLLTEPDYDMLETRLRGACEVPKRITILFNPIHTGHWLYKRFFDGKFPEDARRLQYDVDFQYTDISGEEPVLVNAKREISIHKSTHWDNKFLASEDRVRYESWKETNTYMYNVMCLGNWGVLGDLIFPEYHVRDLSKLTFTKVFDGLDFGWFPDPTACMSVAIHKGCIYILAESGGHKQLTQEIARMIKPQLNGRAVICDNNETRTINELKEHGISTIPVTKWRDNNKSAIEYFQNYKIVVDYRCKEFLAELMGYVWEKDKNGDHTGRPVDGNDHYIQAGFYALNDKIKGHRKGHIGK